MEVLYKPYNDHIVEPNKIAVNSGKPRLGNSYTAKHQRPRSTTKPNISKHKT